MKSELQAIHIALKDHIEKLENLQDLCKAVAPELIDYLEMSKCSLYDTLDQLYEAENKEWQLCE